MNEFEVKRELEEKRKEIKSFDDLIAFLQEVKVKYVGRAEHECIDDAYGYVPRAIAQAALATAWEFSRMGEISGFQAGFVMWDFIRDWEFPSNKSGLRIIDYDNMLYPQYRHKFEKTITEKQWESIQKEAQRQLDENEKATCKAHPTVVAHWRSIVDGTIPFGYTISED